MKRLSRTGRYTFRYHAASSALEGVVQGALQLNDIVLKKTLGASDLVLTLFVAGQSVSLLFPASWTDFTGGRYLRRSYLWFGAFGRLMLAALFFVHAPLPFAALVVAATVMYYALLPAQNMLLQANYAPDERGRAFGRARVLYALALLAAAWGAGRLLERDGYAYRHYYLAVGVLGFAGCWLLYRVRPRRLPGAADVPRPDLPSLAALRPSLVRLASSLANPFAGSLRTLRSDRAFRAYEIHFFLYGLAFMMLQPVLPVFLVEDLGIEYDQAATAKGLVLYGMFVLFSPLAGRLSDRLGPVRLAAGAFALLALFPTLLGFSTSVGGVYAAFAVYGMAMAAVDVAWNMGPIHFAQRRDATVYMGTHTALVAVRAVIGAPAGMALMRAFGTPRATFVVAATLFVVAAFGMRALARALPPVGARGSC